MINLDLFQSQSGDYSAIVEVITAGDAIAFDGIYQALTNHASQTTDINGNPNTLQAYIDGGVCVAIEGVNIAAIATLKAVGLIVTSDNLHIGLTPLGYGFYQFIQV